MPFDRPDLYTQLLLDSSRWRRKQMQWLLSIYLNQLVLNDVVVCFVQVKAGHLLVDYDLAFQNPVDVSWIESFSFEDGFTGVVFHFFKAGKNIFPFLLGDLTTIRQHFAQSLSHGFGLLLFLIGEFLINVVRNPDKLTAFMHLITIVVFESCRV